MGTKNYAYINGKILKWAREQTPFYSLEEMTPRLKKLKIKNEEVIEWENGSKYPTINQAKNLAKLYNISFAALYLSEIPKINKPEYIDRRVVNNNPIYEISYELWRGIRDCISKRDILLDIAPDFISTFNPLPKLKSDSIPEIVKKIRTYLKLETTLNYYKDYNNPFNYFRKILEQNGIMVFQLSNIPITEMKGISIYYEKLPIIIINNKDWAKAKVFTLFHELAHLLRRTSSLCLVDLNQTHYNEEKICDKIAAEILLPEEEFYNNIADIKKNLNKENEFYLYLEKVANQFGVSPVVVLRRLYDLDIIDLEYYNNQYKKLSESFNKNKNKNKGNLKIKQCNIYLSKNGYLFPRGLLNTYSNGDISYGEMCFLLDIKSKHITSIEERVMFV